jgi:purine-nucleoside phosphorylase
MVIKDHGSYPLLALNHPLVGPNDERFGARFTPINNVYDKKLRELMLECANELKIKMHEGLLEFVAKYFHNCTVKGLFLEKRHYFGR